MARFLKPLVRSGGYYPSRRWTPLVYPGGYTTANGGEEPAPPPIEKTITGNPIHILDALAKPAQSLSVKLEPIQDLHGYDNPWPAGGGKNKFDVSKMVNTAGITVNNGIITVTENSRNSGKKLGELADLVVGDTYTLTATTDGNEQLIYLYGTGANISWSFGTSKTITQDYLDALVFFYGGAGATSHISDMMIRLASVTDATFAPYSNICPISGHTDADVVRTGVNVWDEETRRGYYSSATGVFVNDGSATMANNTPISVFPATTYYLKSATYSVVLFCYDKDMNFISAISGKTNSVFTTPANCYYINFCNAYNSGTTYNNDISINYPSTDHDYHAYTGTTYPIPLGQTVYGGTLDVVTGVLTVTMAMVDLGTLTWEYNTAYAFFVSNSLTGRKLGVKNIVSDLFKTEPGSWSGVPKTNAIWGNGSSKTIYVQYPITEVSEFLSLISGHQLCYELGNPITIQLTPQQVELLLGENNIWSDGEMTLVYLADGNASDAEALNILLGGRYTNTHEADEPSDREALDILLGR